MSDLPTIRIQGDQQLGRQYIPAARAKLDRLREMLSHRGVAVGGDHGPLADGVYCYVRVAGGVSVIQILAEEQPKEPPSFEAVAKIKFPDFVSGVVVGGYAKDGATNYFKPTAETALKHDLAREFRPSERLVVEPHSSMDVFQDKPSEFFGFPTQYAKFRPGLYSGTMRKLVQFIAGYGRIPEETIYKDKIETTEPDYTFPTDPTYTKAITEDGVQIRYDFRFARTHGLTQASDGKWWIVEIAAGRGILAMPVKVYQETTTASFRQMLVDKNDQEALEVVDMFGGLPTGESLPGSTIALEAYIRAGLVLRLQPSSAVQPFYDCSYYSSGCGWAFNENGSEAHNTAYYVAESGLKMGVHYATNISIGETREIDPPGAALRLKQYIAKAKEDLPGLMPALTAKCDLLTDDQIAELMREHSALAAARALDDIVVPPVAAGTASQYKLDEGAIYFAARRSPVFKVYEPMLGELVSMDFRPEPIIRSFPGLRCNTTLYVYFSGMELRKAKFYLVPGESYSSSESFGEQECQYAGTWGYRAESGNKTVYPFFYTSEIDTREPVPASRSYSTSTGVDIGYTACAYGDNPARPWEGSVFRTKSFAITTKSESYASKSKAGGILVPGNDREAYYYFERTVTSGAVSSTSNGFLSLADPNVYTYGRLFAGVDATPEGCPKRSTFRRVAELVKGGGPCSDLADEGPWLSRCQIVETLDFNIPLVAPPGTSEYTEAINEMKMWLVASGRSPMEVMSFTITGPDAPFAGDSYFIMVPAEGTQWIRINRNCFGALPALFYDPILNSTNYVSEGAPADMNGAFIGVCND